MRESDLTRDLAAARDALASADLIAGRQAVERRVKQHQVQRAVAVLAIVFVLVGSAAIGLTRAGEEEQGLITTPTVPPVAEPLPRLVPRYLPDGYTVTELVDYAAMEAEMETVDPVVVESFALWVDGSEDTPVAGSRVVIASVFSGADPRDGRGSDLAVSVNTVMVRAEWQVGDRYWNVLGRGIDEGFVRDLVDQIHRSSGDGGPPVLPPPPAGFRELAAGGPFEASSTFGMEQFARPGSMDGYMLGTSFTGDGSFVDEGGSGAIPGLIVRRSGPASEWFTYASGSDPLGAAVVQGRRATLWQLMGEACSGQSSAAAAPEGSAGPGNESCERVPVGNVLTIEWTGDISVSVYGGSEEDVKRIADGLEEVDDATWVAYISTLSSIGEDSSDPFVPPEPLPGPDGPSTTLPPDDE